MKIKDPKFFGFIRDFLAVHLPVHKASSAHTVKSYRETINLFLTYVCDMKNIRLEDVSITDVNTETILRFLDWLCDVRGCTASTRNHRLAVIRSLLKYIGKREPTQNEYYVESMQVPFKKIPKNMVVRHFDDDAFAAILRQPNPQQKSGHRDLFFMILLYDTGARDSEILNLKIGDVVTDTKAPYVCIKGKGGKTRTIPIMKETVEHYITYMKRFHADSKSDDYLFFVIQHGQRQRMSDDNVEKFIGKYANEARNSCTNVPQKVTPHMFRHSRSLSLYRNGMPLPLISEWLGHAHMETTLIYAFADTEMKRAAIEKATEMSHPLRGQKASFEFKKDEETIRKLLGL
jgi:site-specific recombinase XerD